MYELLIEKKVLKKLSQIDEKSQIFEKILSLQEDPFPSEAKKLVNVKDKVFRIRSGNYRILYRIQEKLVVVFFVDKRGRVYKR